MLMIKAINNLSYSEKERIKECLLDAIYPRFGLKMSTNRANVISFITNATQKLIGLKVTCIKKEGYCFTLEFGDKRTFKATKPISKIEPDGMRLRGTRFFHHTRSEWELDLEGAWRIDKDSVPYCHYLDANKDEAIKLLVGKKLINITFAGNYLDTQFHFKDDIILHIFSIYTEKHFFIEDIEAALCDDTASSDYLPIWSLSTLNNKRLAVYSENYEWENIVDDGKKLLKL